LSTHRDALSTPLPAGTPSDGCAEGYSRGTLRGTHGGTLRGAPRLRSGVLLRDSVGPGVLRVLTGALGALPAGTRSTHRVRYSEHSQRSYSEYSQWGYSEYSHGVLRVLTHLGLPVGCACGGVPITCRETRAPPPGVPSCKPRWVSTQSTPVCTQSSP
jgi:hypothetical protein